MSKKLILDEGRFNTASMDRPDAFNSASRKALNQQKPSSKKVNATTQPSQETPSKEILRTLSRKHLFV